MTTNDLEKEYDKLEKKENKKPVNKVKAFRARYNLTQDELGKLINRKRRIIQYYEAGNKISEAFLYALLNLEKDCEELIEKAFADWYRTKEACACPKANYTKSDCKNCFLKLSLARKGEKS